MSHNTMLARITFYFSLVSLATAQFGPGGRYGPYRGPDPGPGYGPYGRGGRGRGPFGYTSYQDFLNQREKIVIAHGVLAALAFVIFFPAGAILIRLGSFRGAWLIHGLLQTFALVTYIAAFGIGVWMVNNVPVNLLDHYHPIIGIVVLVLLAFQPILGLLHHSKFKKHGRRTIWTYGHLWLGRIAITLGIINGGLGMLFATETRMFVPTRGQMIAYGVVAGLVWLLWVSVSVFGEVKRVRERRRVSTKEAELEGKDQYA
ncbi:hypothetical protein BU24DRAFT_427198 [Aaosphaeria arxii CBS 175.79]|uniref:Cytochrome b561 domain-containing protein n=1 Tax=Aaosphaeria arxii CBS 175.79 TaxID=1450172 RepID=A0A6A5XDV0_9PLEO|nr:uncharacterized protein BU24DRAFT_427198 [Aaosphaeria arxii CBS 175.79]KAF2010996.1 hypothetical protein BU24DRAFT_427198 [Aaosphaeria arxii CBS 175.79]